MLPRFFLAVLFAALLQAPAFSQVVYGPGFGPQITQVTKAQRILTAAQNAQPAIVSAVTPTIGTNYAATTIPNPVTVNPTSAVVSGIGGNWIYSSTQSAYIVANATPAASGDPYGVQGAGLRFATDASTFDFGINSGNSDARFRVRYRLLSGGAWTWLSAADVAPTWSAAYGTYHVTYNLGSSAPRIIEIYFPDSTVVHDIDISRPYSFWAAPRQSVPRCGVYSDSYGRGSTNATSHTSAVRGGWWDVAGDAMGIDMISSSLGGTGYLTNVPTYNLGQRLATDIARFGDLDCVIVAMGANDGASSGPALQAAVTADLQIIRAAQPTALIQVLGPWHAPGLSSVTATDTAIMAGCAAAGVGALCTDTWAEAWQSATGFTGSITGTSLTYPSGTVLYPGQILTTTGSTAVMAGTSIVSITNGTTAVISPGQTVAAGTALDASLYLGTDASHPNDAGYAYLGNREINDLTAFATTLAGAQ